MCYRCDFWLCNRLANQNVMFERPRLLISLEGSVSFAQKSCSKTTDYIPNSSEPFPLLACPTGCQNQKGACA